MYYTYLCRYIYTYTHARQLQLNLPIQLLLIDQWRTVSDWALKHRQLITILIHLRPRTDHRAGRPPPRYHSIPTWETGGEGDDEISPLSIGDLLVQWAVWGREGGCVSCDGRRGLTINYDDTRSIYAAIYCRRPTPFVRDDHHIVEYKVRYYYLHTYMTTSSLLSTTFRYLLTSIAHDNLPYLNCRKELHKSFVRNTNDNPVITRRVLLPCNYYRWCARSWTLMDG